MNRLNRSNQKTVKEIFNIKKTNI